MTSVTRRSLLTGSAALAAVGAAPLAGGAVPGETGVDGKIDVTLLVNGKPQELRLDPRVTVLDALRDHLQLTGTKKGCDQGQCGACTVHLDGKRVLSCLTLAAAVDGRHISTIEGLAAADGTLHPMQRAFVEHDAFQCGYCTPGQI